MNQFQVATRLDRFLISESIIMQGLTLDYNILPWGGSDHWLVQLEAGFQTTPKNKPFRFEKFWIDHPTFKEKIKQWWWEEQPEQGTRMFKLHKKLKYIRKKLKEWNRDIFGNINTEKNDIEEKMKKLQETCLREGYTEDRKKEELQMTQEWEARCQQEETLWHQKSRIRWLKEGERNTKFFHRTTMARRAHNKILKIKDQDGIERESHQEIESALVSHFHGIAQEPHQDRSEAIQKITQHIPRLVTEEQNIFLNKPIATEEVDQALQEMPSGKAPGPDGFTVEFFKACWEIVKYDIYKVVEDSRRSASILKALNATMITLIPKENEAKTPDRYRPIALCNVIYKIISKVIENRLKPLLPSLISQEQAGFVEGRQIMDNIIQAHEIIHTLKLQKRGGMLIQLDLAKAYDKISWHYMIKTLEAFGFTQHWISWIVSLVSTTSYSLLINGAPTKPFWPTRGIRQGDPLSPFLFILMMEGLSRSIKSATTTGEITGLKPFENFPTSTHQQFVDDTLLHDIPTVKEAKAYKRILEDFGEASGAEINHSKSMIFFFNTNPAIQRNLTNILGFERKTLPTKYLGVPLTDKVYKLSTWEGVINRLQERVKNWTYRSLNLAGRLILTKTVLQAIPTYMMSVFPTPQGILQKIRSIQRDFLWRGAETKKKWALVAWEKVCRPKSKGGLGLQDPQMTNNAYGVKLWWRWVKETTTPWVNLWKEKYAPDTRDQDRIHFGGTREGSTIWNLAWHNKAWIQTHNFWEIRNGRTTRFWEDAWQQEPRMENPDRGILQQDLITQGKINVYRYWQQGTDRNKWRTWDKIIPQNNEIPATTIKEVEEELGRRKITVTEGEDQLRWGKKDGGEFNLKEVWHYMADPDQDDLAQHWDKLWNNPQWPKIKIFQWLILHNRILTWDNLRKRGFTGPSRCHLCQTQEETTNHLLDECAYTAELWDWAASIFRQSDRIRGNIAATIKLWRENYNDQAEVNLCWILTPGMIIWSTWKERNRRIFRNQSWPEGKIKETITSMIRETVMSQQLPGG
jgi:hypothetical protein